MSSISAANADYRGFRAGLPTMLAAGTTLGSLALWKFVGLGAIPSILLGIPAGAYAVSMGMLIGNPVMNEVPGVNPKNPLPIRAFNRMLTLPTLLRGLYSPGAMAQMNDLDNNPYTQPLVGDVPPSFPLVSMDGTKKNLEEFLKESPVTVLNFGSYT